MRSSRLPSRRLASSGSWLNAAVGGQKDQSDRMWLNDRIRNIIARYRFNRTYGRHLGVLSVTDKELSLGRYRLQGTTTILENDWSLPWLKIRKIQAYKRDCYITNLICLAIETEDGRQFEVNEEMDGWREMQAALAARFGIQGDAWFAEVAVPAFETNQKTLRTREGEESMAFTGCMSSRRATARGGRSAARGRR